MSLQEIIESMSDREKELFNKKMNDDGFVKEPIPVTFFFPEKFNLESFSVYNYVPRVGETVSIGGLGGLIREGAERYDYEQKKNKKHYIFDWKVDKIWNSIQTHSCKKDSLIMDSSIRVEVYLKPHYPLKYVWYNFKRWCKTCV